MKQPEPYRAIAIDPATKVVKEAVIPRKEQSLAKLQELCAIGRNKYIELVHLRVQTKDVVIYVNEEGLLHPSVPFRIKDDRRGYIELRGPAVLLGKVDPHGHNTSLPAAITCSNLDIQFSNAKPEQVLQ